MSVSLRDGLRESAITALFFLPGHRRRALDRWLRGREEARKLDLADVAVVSWGKSGRTWLRVMISRYYQLLHGLDEGQMLEFDNLHKKVPDIPRIFFTHGNYLRDFTDSWQDKGPFFGRKVVLLIRDPRDIAVSQYYQWKYRMRQRKKLLNFYPPHGADTELFDFVMDEGCGLPVILEFLSQWERDLPRCGPSLVVRYEDMRSHTATELARVMAHLDGAADQARVAEAVEYASVDNMRRLEEKSAFRSWGHRLRPGDKSNPQSFKVRRAKVGGHRDDFTPDQLAAIDALLRERPVFGYDATQEASMHAAQ